MTPFAIFYMVGLKWSNEMAMILPKVDKSTDVNKFPDNPIFGELPGLGYYQIKRMWIDFDRIVANPDDNIYRIGGNNMANQNNLKDSLSMGIYTSEPLPVVEKLDLPFISRNEKTGAVIKDFVLRDGFNRVSALKVIGYKGYIFDVMTFDSDDTRSKFSARSNRHCPKAASNDKDMENMAQHLVKRGIVKNDHDSVKDWLMENCAIRANRASRLSSLVMNNTLNSDGIIILSPSDLREISKSLDITVDGKWDSKRKKYGYHVRSGYEARTLMKILRNFYEHPNELSYVTICTAKFPDKHETVDTQRQGNIDTMLLLEDYLDHYAEWKVKNPGKRCWDFIGALPQRTSERNKNELIPMKLEKSLKAKGKFSSLFDIEYSEENEDEDGE